MVKKINKDRGVFGVVIRFQNNRYTTIDDKRVVCPGYGEAQLFWVDADAFWYDQSGNECTTVFTMSESHGPASWDYFLKNTHAPKTKEEITKANSLFRWYYKYCQQPCFDGEPLPVRRLKRSYPRVKTLTEDELASQLFGVDNNQ